MSQQGTRGTGIKENQVSYVRTVSDEGSRNRYNCRERDEDVFRGGVFGHLKYKEVEQWTWEVDAQKELLRSVGRPPVWSDERQGWSVCTSEGPSQ